eukprot:1354108-Pyramimonas_sp.AAC.1
MEERERTPLCRRESAMPLWSLHCTQWGAWGLRGEHRASRARLSRAFSDRCTPWRPQPPEAPRVLPGGHVGAFEARVAPRHQTPCGGAAESRSA